MTNEQLAICLRQIYDRLTAEIGRIDEGMPDSIERESKVVRKDIYDPTDLTYIAESLARATHTPISHPEEYERVEGSPIILDGLWELAASIENSMNDLLGEDQE